MPDKSGKLTADERDKVIQWINRKGVNHQCPVCTHNQWSVGEHMLSGMVHTGGGLTIGGPSYPSVILVCGNCAYTRHFMAIPIGILSQSAEGGEGKEDE